MKKICFVLLSFILIHTCLHADNYLSDKKVAKYKKYVHKKRKDFFGYKRLTLALINSVNDIETAHQFIEPSSPFYKEKSIKIQRLMTKASSQSPKKLLRFFLYLNDHYPEYDIYMINQFKIHNPAYLKKVIKYADKKPCAKAYAIYLKNGKYEDMFKLWKIAQTKYKYQYIQYCKNIVILTTTRTTPAIKRKFFEALHSADKSILKQFSSFAITQYFKTITDIAYLEKLKKNKGNLSSFAERRFWDIKIKEEQERSKREIEKRRIEREKREKEFAEQRRIRKLEQERRERERREKERIAESKRQKRNSQIKLIGIIIASICGFFFLITIIKSIRQANKEEQEKMNKEAEEAKQKQKAKEKQKKEREDFLATHYEDHASLNIDQLIEKLNYFGKLKNIIENPNKYNYKKEFEIFSSICENDEDPAKVIFQMHRAGCYDFEFSGDRSIISANARRGNVGIFATPTVTHMLYQSKDGSFENMNWKRTTL